MKDDLQKSTDFLYWLGNYTKGAKKVRVAAAALTPQIKEIINYQDMSKTGFYMGVMIQVVPNYEVVE